MVNTKVIKYGLLVIISVIILFSCILLLKHIFLDIQPSLEDKNIANRIEKLSHDKYRIEFYKYGSYVMLYNSDDELNYLEAQKIYEIVFFTNTNSMIRRESNYYYLNIYDCNEKFKNCTFEYQIYFNYNKKLFEISKQEMT